MITSDTPIDKQIKFYEGKINQYLETIMVNEKGENCLVWLGWIGNWNREIIELKKQLK